MNQTTKSYVLQGLYYLVAAILINLIVPDSVKLGAALLQILAIGFIAIAIRSFWIASK